jgi:hypothetical protein
MVLIIPEFKRSPVYARLEDLAIRIDRIKQVFADTIWVGALSEIRDMRGLRVLLFGRDGSVVVIRSRQRSRWAYHLAALVGIYVVRKGYSGQLPSYG